MINLKKKKNSLQFSDRTKYKNCTLLPIVFIMIEIFRFSFYFIFFFFVYIWCLLSVRIKNVPTAMSLKLVKTCDKLFIISGNPPGHLLKNNPAYAIALVFTVITICLIFFFIGNVDNRWEIVVFRDPVYTTIVGTNSFRTRALYTREKFI